MSETPVGAPSPIADLSYRTYDGPLNERTFRFWIVTVAGIRQAIKKKGFWIMMVLGALPWLIAGIQLYIESRSQSLMGGAAPSNINPLNVDLPGQRFAGRFYSSFQNQGFFLFIISLMVGAGCIAADNRTNALIVYLSKPLTKGDYLLGKWMTTFIMVFAASAAPAVLLYLYCLTSYLSEGFLSKEPWLLFRMLSAAAVAGAVHASLLTGFSAWSKTPRMAGASYAGFYFLSGMVSGAIWAIRFQGDLSKGGLVRSLNVDGLIQACSQNIYGVVIKLNMFRRSVGRADMVEIAHPTLLVAGSITIAICALFVMAAYRKIRAVEVVKG